MSKKETVNLYRFDNRICIQY